MWKWFKTGKIPKVKNLGGWDTSKVSFNKDAFSDIKTFKPLDDFLEKDKE